MSNIYQVVSNLKHDGTVFAKDSFVFDNEIPGCQDLANDGTLRLIPDASTKEEAAEYVAAEKEKAAEDQADAENAAPQNTWGPKPDEVPAAPADAENTQQASAESAPSAPAAPSTPAPTLVKYKVLKDFTVDNEQSANYGPHAVGSEIEADPAAAQPLVDNGTLAVAEEVSGDNL